MARNPLTKTWDKIHATMRAMHRLWRAMLALGMLLAWCPCAWALDPSLDISQYAHTAWKVRDGFFKGQIGAIAQTPDGYLWLGTGFGLLRFDGVRSVPWQPPAGEHLPNDNNFVRALLTASDGTLWIATDGGLASWKDGKLRQFPQPAGIGVISIFEGHDGTIWFGTVGPLAGRLCALRSASVQCYGDDSTFGRGVDSIYEDSAANLWVGATKGLFRWKPGPPKLYPMRDSVVRIIEGERGTALLTTFGGIKQLVDGKVEPYHLPGSRGQFIPGGLLRDRDGSLWVGTSERGLLHVHQGSTDVFAPSDGLSGDSVRSLFEDKEGNIWIATSDGLDRFRGLAVPTISAAQGLSSSGVFSVLAATDGSIWLSTTNGLSRWREGQVTIYRTRSDRAASGGDRRVLPEIVDSGLPDNAITSLFQDGRGRIWVSTLCGIAYFENGRFIRVSAIPPGPGAWSIAQDDAENLWFSQNNGLFHLLNENPVERIHWAMLGLQGPALALLPDSLHGGLWFGSRQDGIAYLKDGQVRASYTAAAGLGGGVVNHLRFDKDGALWAATQGGLSRVKDGQVATLASRNGLPCDTVHWSMEDNEHSVWVYMACGLVRIRRSDLDTWVTDPKRTIQVAVFDNSDGIRANALTSQYSPQVAKSKDGKLWFLPGDGVGVIDPRNLHLNKLPPPVRVEQITADRKTYWQNSFGDASSSSPKLPPLVRDLEIDYTALSFVTPEKNRFRVKLEGWDRDWQDVGNRRQAFYTNLSPGSYRFRVTASNNSGVWNEAGTFLDFSIAPAYYQTNWFRATCVAALMVLLWGLYRLRLRQMAERFNVRMEERLGERMRIARDLHDTLLQSFHGLLLRFQTVSNELPPGNSKQKLDSAIDQAAEAITEGRDAVQGLRSSTIETNDLALAIRAIGEELAADATNGDSVEFRVQVEGTPRNLHPILRDEVYRIAGEALRNAFRHAQARHIEVEIRYDERQLRVRVRDNGKGIDQKVLGGDEPAGHFGLHGMRERAELIGGKLTVWSELDSGTEVELSIPASNAYAKSPGTSRSWLTEKLTGKFSGKDTAMKS